MIFDPDFDEWEKMSLKIKNPNIKYFLMVSWGVFLWVYHQHLMLNLNNLFIKMDQKVLLYTFYPLTINCRFWVKNNILF